MVRFVSSNPTQVLVRSLALVAAASLMSTALAQSTMPAASTAASSGATDEPLELEKYIVVESAVANDTPASAYATPVSKLRYDPRVDVQSRNFSEAQGDISIRGGIFEGTAIDVGGLTIFDPQTGHYAAELPIPAAMLKSPQVLTGLDHSLEGMNATAGTIDYRWQPIENRGEVSLGLGNGSLNTESLYVGRIVQQGGPNETTIGSDAEWSHSKADGLIANGDHDFQRIAARFEISSSLGKTEIFGGYQDKFFGWPDLYTPFGVPETEKIRTTLFAITHEMHTEIGRLDAGVDYRKNTDDYEFNRFIPGLYNAYQHKTEVAGAYAELHSNIADWTTTVRGELAADSLDSTALLFGKFMSRTYGKLGALAARRFEISGGAWDTRLGGTLDETNHEGGAFSPLAEFGWTPTSGLFGAKSRSYVQYSEATRVPGYTALNSNPKAGLFRGNRNLGREKSKNLELGLEARTESWSMHAAIFRRTDDPLVDWTFPNDMTTARSARAVDIRTTGAEFVASRAWSMFSVVGSYTWLKKDSNYLDQQTQPSFYALNFPDHRFTAAITAHLGGGVEIRCDNEYRIQESNLLRTAGGDRAFLTSLGVYWLPEQIRGLELSLVVDNLWKSDFQEIPAVPASGRQVTAGMTWRW